MDTFVKMMIQISQFLDSNVLKFKILNILLFLFLTFGSSCIARTKFSIFAIHSEFSFYCPSKHKLLQENNFPLTIYNVIIRTDCFNNV